MNEIGQRGQPRQVQGELWHDEVHYGTYLFTEGTRGDDHRLEDEYSDDPVLGDAVQQHFEEFMQEQKIRIVAERENSWVEIPRQDNFDAFDTCPSR